MGLTLSLMALISRLAGDLDRLQFYLCTGLVDRDFALTRARQKVTLIKHKSAPTEA